VCLLVKDLVSGEETVKAGLHHGFQGLLEGPVVQPLVALDLVAYDLVDLGLDDLDHVAVLVGPVVNAQGVVQLVVEEVVNQVGFQGQEPGPVEAVLPADEIGLRARDGLGPRVLVLGDHELVLGALVSEDARSRTHARGYRKNKNAQVFLPGHQTKP